MAHVVALHSKTQTKSCELSFHNEILVWENCKLDRSVSCCDDYLTDSFNIGVISIKWRTNLHHHGPIVALNSLRNQYLVGSLGGKIQYSHPVFLVAGWRIVAVWQWLSQVNLFCHMTLSFFGGAHCFRTLLTCPHFFRWGKSLSENRLRLTIQ